MAGTSEGAKKAASHRDPESFREAGRKGAEAINSDPQKKSEASQKAASHRDMSEMGRKGGESSHSGGRKKEDQE